MIGFNKKDEFIEKKGLQHLRWPRELSPLVYIKGSRIKAAAFFWLYALNEKEVSITAKLKLPVFVSLGIGVLNIIGSVVLCKYTNLGIFAIQIASSVLLTARFFSLHLFMRHIY